MKQEKSLIRAADTARISSLRQRAEQHLHSHDSPIDLSLSFHDTQRLAHELQVHQIELEMQNETLRSAQQATETALARYTDLYDSAPTGYFTLNRLGNICQTNIVGAGLLGMDRLKLSNLNFRAFVCESDLLRFNQSLDRLFEDDVPVSCDVMLIRQNQSRLPVQIDATLSADQQECRVEVRDITASKRVQFISQQRQSVLKQLTDRVSLTVVLESMLRDIEAMNADMRCSILLLNTDSQQLETVAAPGLPRFYTEGITNLANDPTTEQAGHFGTPAYAAKRMIIEDIDSHPDWTWHRQLAKRAGLRSCWSQPIVSEGGELQGLFVIYHQQPCLPTQGDLTLIEDEATLASLAIDKSADFEKLQLAANVFTHAREGIMITDADGTIIEANDTFSLITGYSREEVLGNNPRMLQSGRHSAEFYAQMWSSLQTSKHWSGEFWNRHKNGDLYAQQMTISAVSDANNQIRHFVSLITDITVMKQHQQQLEHIAHYDTLTNLPNRVLLAERIRRAMDQCERCNQSLAIAYLDLDGFKAINDYHDHKTGDELLITLATRMKAELRSGDTLACIGGDEFIALLVDLETATDCEPVLDRLLLAAASPVKLGSSTLQLSASIGVTLYPKDFVDADHLIRHANQAMVIAKQTGKNRYHLFDVDRDASAKTHREDLKQIERALEHHEFVPYYQPKVNMKTGDVIGAELLTYWQHPDRGLLAPGDYLPIIENYPISVELGDWVIESALAQLSDWQAVGLHLPVSVNVDALQLQDQSFTLKLTNALAKYPDVNPQFLELEILETSALEDITKVSAIMHACRALGVGFALDDFGTGFSSLTYLKRLPADMLKIDRSFVQDILHNPDDRAIVTGVIGLAAAFQRQVIAEGVESIAHGTQLLAMGCVLAQGFGIARPMLASQLPRWAANWRPDKAWKP